MDAMVREPELANLLGALSLAVIDRIEQGARDIIGHAGETPAALIVIGYGPITNDKLRRILGLSHSGTVRLVDRLVSDRLVERRPGKDGREVALHLTAKGAASRKDLLTSRISAVASFVDVLSASERKRLGELIRNVLARQDTSEMDRFTICRMCDNGVCSNCPLPTTVSTRDPLDRIGRVRKSRPSAKGQPWRVVDEIVARRSKDFIVLSAGRTRPES
jgi:MarR family transcriptional repressor of emrRAB